MRIQREFSIGGSINPASSNLAGTSSMLFAFAAAAAVLSGMLISSLSILMKTPGTEPVQDTERVELVFELEGFNEARPVFLFTAPQIEGEALCLTQNAKVCEQLLDFSTGDTAVLGAYLPKNAEMLGILEFEPGIMDWMYSPFE